MPRQYLLRPGADVLTADDLDVDGKKVMLWDPVTKQMMADGAPVSVERIRRSGRSMMMVTAGFSQPTGAAGGTYSTCVAPKSTTLGAFRVVFRNFGGAPANITMKYAASATLANNGAALALLPITWGGATTGVAAAVSLNQGQNVPGVIKSDWMNFAPVARSDGGTFPCLYTRLTAPEALIYDSFNYTDANYSIYEVRTGYSAAAVADGVALNPGATFCTVPSISFEFASDIDATFSGAVFADSLAAGFADDSISYLQSLNKLLNDNSLGGSMLMQQARGGQYKTTTSLWMRNFFALSVPDLVVMHDFSTNDGVPPNSNARILAQLVEDVLYARSMGAKVIVLINHTHSGDLSFGNSAIRALTGLATIVDMRPLLCAPGTETIDARYTVGNGGGVIHLNQVGSDVVGAAVYAAIRSLLS